MPDRAATLGQAEQAVKAAQQARVDLETGSGVWTGTEAGRAVRELAEARANRQRAEWTAEHGARRRDRRAGRKEGAEWARREVDAQQRCIAFVAPEMARLDQEIARRQASLEHTGSRIKRREVATQGVIRDGLEHRKQASRLDGRLIAERDHLDGVPSAADIRRAALRTEQLRSVGLTPQHGSPGGWAAPGIEM